MKVATYKGYDIEFEDWRGYFTINGISGSFDKYKSATAKIDIVSKAEVKKNFPIDVISSDMKVGKLTSYNKVEKDAWFSPDKGRRGKECLVGYSGVARFFAANSNNLSAVHKYHELSNEIARLNKEQRKLEEALTEPIVLDMEMTNGDD